MSNNLAKILIVMGVSGCGKSTIGSTLADDLKWTFYDGDDFHPDGNIKKMSDGIPLTDDDRMPWLDNLRALIDKHITAGNSAIIACSALKHSYRTRLKQNNKQVVFVFLNGDFDLIWSRMSQRKDHFMKADMLRSQFETLEPPDEAEAVIIDISKSTDEIISDIKAKLS